MIELVKARRSSMVRLGLRLGASVGLALLVTSQAQAQSAPGAEAPAAEPAPADNNNDIIVTAQRRSERLESVPVAITALTVPEIVDRRELVLRSGETQVLISDNHLWAEALKNEIARNLGAHLARAEGTTGVFLPGEKNQAAAEIKLAVDILRFESVLGGNATLEARWNIARQGATPVSGHALIQEPANAPGYDALVEAHSRALARLSDKIAATLNP